MTIIKRFLWLLLLLVSIIVTIIEGVILGISYSLRFIGFVLHEAFKWVCEVVIRVASAFNFIKVFRNRED